MGTWARKHRKEPSMDGAKKKVLRPIAKSLEERNHCFPRSGMPNGPKWAKTCQQFVKKTFFHVSMFLLSTCFFACGDCFPSFSAVLCPTAVGGSACLKLRNLRHASGHLQSTQDRKLPATNRPKHMGRGGETKELQMPTQSCCKRIKL